MIRDCLDELGVNVTDGAKALGVTHAALSRVLNRKAAASAEMAVRLEKAIGSTAGFWLRLQLNYDLAQVQARDGFGRSRRPVLMTVYSSQSENNQEKCVQFWNDWSRKSSLPLKKKLALNFRELKLSIRQLSKKYLFL